MAMTVVVLEVIAWALQGVKRLILNAPARPPCPHEPQGIVSMDFDVGDPGKMPGGAIG